MTHLQAHPTAHDTLASLLVPLALLAPSPTNPRRRIVQATIDSLADSIAEHQVMQPILARPNVHAPDGAPRFEIVAGERRWRACSQLQQAGRNPHDGSIPCLVRELTDAQVLAMQLVENMHRDDLHPLDEAEHYRRMRDDPLAPCSVEAISRVAKVSPSRVYERLSLLALVPAAREAFEAERLTLKTALLVARMPAALQAEATRHLADWGGEPMGPKAAAQFLRERYMLRLTQAPFPTADDTLLPEAGSCATCPKRTGANPQLFGDISDADTCTDPTCFDAKKAAQRERVVDELRITGYTVLQHDAARDVCTPDGRAVKPGWHLLEGLVPHHLGDPTLTVQQVMEAARAPHEHTRAIDHPAAPYLSFAVPTPALEAALRRVKAHRTQLDKAARKAPASAAAPVAEPAAPATPAPAASALQAALDELDRQGWVTPAPRDTAQAGGANGADVQHVEGSDVFDAAEQQALLQDLLAFKPPATSAGRYMGRTLAEYERQQRLRARGIITAARVAAHMRADGAEGLPAQGLAAMIIVTLLYGDSYLSLPEVAQLCGAPPPPARKLYGSKFDTGGDWARGLHGEVACRVAMALLAAQDCGPGGSDFDDFPDQTAAALGVAIADVDALAAESVAHHLQLGVLTSGEPQAGKAAKGRGKGGKKSTQGGDSAQAAASGTSEAPTR